MSPLIVNTSPEIYVPRKYTHLWRGPVGSAAVPQPSDKAGMLWGLDPRSGVSFSSGVNISQIDDASGNGRHTTFAVGKHAEYVASYLSTGNPAIKCLATTLGIFSTDVMVGGGADHGVFLMLHDIDPGGTYYHTYVQFRTAAANTDQPFGVTSDPIFGTFANLTGAASVAIGNTSARTAIVAAPSAWIWNYTGGAIGAVGSYNSRLNNSPLALSALTGATSTGEHGNFISSYGYASPPQFGAINSFLIGAWLYDSPITDAQADNIFKPFAQSYGMTQA